MEFEINTCHLDYSWNEDDECVLVVCVGLFKAMKMHHGSTIENRNYVSVNEICICLHTCGKRKSYTRDALSMNNIWSIIFIFIYCRKEFILKTLAKLRMGIN